MNILLVTDSYPPEIRSASHLMQELAEGLQSRGHEVTVVTSHPRYNLHRSAKALAFDQRSIENGIEVIRVKTLPHHNVNFFFRGIAQILMPFQFMWKLSRYRKRKLDAVIVYSPPLPLSRVGCKIKEQQGALFVLSVQDIFPQNAIDLGIMKSGGAIRFFEKMERKAYDRSDVIAVHSGSNKDYLVAHRGVSDEKVTTVYNWIDLSPFRHVESNGFFRKEYGLEGKFIFLFAGVIGPSQNLGMVIEVARRVSHLRDIVFLLVGDGIEKNGLEKRVAGLSLENVLFRPFVPKETYPSLVKDADVGLICLSSKNNTPVVPGKLLGYMAASIPVVAFLNRQSDGHRIIEEARCGYSAVSDDIEKMTDLILKVYNERRDLPDYGRNGFDFAAEHFDKRSCIDTVEKLFVHGR